MTVTSLLETRQTIVARALGGAPRLLFESALIMLSVLLGFTVNAYRDRQQSAAAAVAVASGFRQEIERNLRDLQDGHRRHLSFQQHLLTLRPAGAKDSTAIAAIVAAFPEGGLRLPVLSDAAWQTATATNTLRLFDYQTAAVVSQTYVIQRDLVMSTSTLIQQRLFEPATFAVGDVRPTLRMFSALIQQLTAQESLLMDSYRVALTKLPPETR